MKRSRSWTFLISVIFQVAAILMLTGLSAAWLSTNLDIFAKHNELQIDAKGLKIDNYNVYQYNYETNQIDNVYNDQDEYEMTIYDSIFTERNENTLLIFEVFLYNFEPGKKNLTVYVDREHHDTAWNSNKDGERFTSNLIYIKAQTAGSLGIGSSVYTAPDSPENNATKFYTARDGFQRTDVMNEFISVSKRSMTNYELLTSNDRITLNIALTDDELARVSAADGRTEKIPVYFIFDYDKFLIEAQTIQNFSDILILENAAMSYDNDITNFLFVQ